jgi:hypothetical protein
MRADERLQVADYRNGSWAPAVPERFLASSSGECWPTTEIEASGLGNESTAGPATRIRR